MNELGSNEKFWRYSNPPSIFDGKMAARADSPLNFHGKLHNFSSWIDALLDVALTSTVGDS